MAIQAGYPQNGIMSAAYFAVAVLLAAPSLEAWQTQTTLAPSYSTASILNAATNLPSGFAPNTIVSIYGTHLSYNTAGIMQNAGRLPTTLGGVSVYFGLTQANLFFVSPGQINVLVPYDFQPGTKTITVVREGTSGPPVSLALTETAPGLFQLTSNTIIATHADGSVITPDLPADAGEVIVIYAVGLGRTVPDLTSGTVPTGARAILRAADLVVVLNNAALAPGSILYAGVTPGFAGLYQINARLPDPLPPNPEVRVWIGSQASPPYMNLPTRPPTELQ
jgi:uncharacterized protein (TIGR03437 family)